MRDMTTNALKIIVGFIIFWYIGAMFDFMPFFADDLAIRAIGFTGLLIAAVVVICTCWIISEIKNKE